MRNKGFQNKKDEANTNAENDINEIEFDSAYYDDLVERSKELIFTEDELNLLGDIVEIVMSDHFLPWEGTFVWK